MRITPENITEVPHKVYFVFGSNEQGVHGAGAAKQALEFGAIFGKGFGPQGRTFAIPTKNWQIETLDLESIDNYVKRFIEFAKIYKSNNFLVTEIGCGLAGYSPEDIAPMFKDCIKLTNVFLPKRFWEVLKQID